MNKKQKAAIAAVFVGMACLPAVSAAASNDSVVWVLSGTASADGGAKVITVGQPLAHREPAEKPDAAVREAVSPAVSVNRQEESVGVEKAAQADGAAAKKENNGNKKQKTGADSTPGTSISAENPLTVEADAMAYNNTTGDVDARGRVDIRHMQDRYETEHVYGNSQTQQYILPVPVRWTTTGTVMEAEQGTYDGVSDIGDFQHIHGWDNDKYYFQGESGTFDRAANQGVVQKGYFTTKHAVAKVPDYRIEADSIDIYPNDHYLAHNVSLFIKNTRLITLSSYRGSLKDDGTSLWSLIPRPSYDSDNGFGLKNSIQLPVGGAMSDLYFYANLGWYTDAGFKPDVGFQWNTAPGIFKFRYAKEESDLNDDHVWVEKRPSLSFDSRHFYIPRTSFYVGARGEIGQWQEGRVSGSHKQWDVYLSHTPITMGPHLTFYWRMGYLKDYYGYNDSIRRNAYYSVGLNGNYGIWSAWVNYTNNDQKGRTPYSFDTYDMDKPINTGFRVQLTRLDAIGVNYSIDTVDGRLEHRDFTYYRDLHSFYGWIRYRDIDKETQIMIQPKDFSF